MTYFIAVMLAIVVLFACTALGTSSDKKAVRVICGLIMLAAIIFLVICTILKYNSLFF